MVELAIVLPVLVMLLLGIVSAGLAYNQKLSLTNGAREGARYGATYPVGTAGTLNAWLDTIASASTGAVDSGFGSGTPGRVTCVAYVYPAGNGVTTNDQNARRQENGGSVTYSTGTNATCFDDGRISTERRVQVVLQRSSSINAGFVKIPLTLTARGVARYEGSQ
jgi:Flp pilus assembly protein TadG